MTLFSAEVTSTSPEPNALHLPARDCGRCPRLAALRSALQEKLPDYHNAPVASFGPFDARILVVGLAPGLQGANRTGRPFTGDYAGDLLYDTLLKYGFARGRYGREADDGLTLLDCRITNAVRCLPPDNKPIGAEVKNCQPYLQSEIGALPRLQVILALGTVAHGAVLTALGLKKSARRFGHGATHHLENRLTLVNSYHCSRYNTNTGRLTEPMFHQVFETLRKILAAP